MFTLCTNALLMFYGFVLVVWKDIALGSFG